MGRIDEMLERARAFALQKLPVCFELLGVDLAFGFGGRDTFVIDVSYFRANAHLEPWGWEAGLLRDIRQLVPDEVWVGFREEHVPVDRGTTQLDGTWIILDED